ncbi:ABC transporter permease [Actinomadura decatromicini]|uniref:ABC transporter permease subunit n=1 Tax=Actinomadura decatromicini TaxID=2604572 RepID=A0A5D3FWB7_9ACTN|nr:ABC transporter permease [Actinomadura decatromicini]TYK52621.1 ABC transporter permease subunit [Actinomadura decatromicini]
MKAALRAEWAKFRTVRSTVLVPGVAILLGLGIGLLDVSSIDWTATDPASLDPVSESFAGFQFAELAFAALGVLAISSEYGTGLIDTTFLAVPRRRTVYAAKIAVLAAFTLAICTVTAFTAFLLGQAVLSGHHASVSLDDPGVLRAVVCAAVYMTVVTLVGFAVGALIRHTAGAMAVMFGLVFLAWPVARAVEGISTLPSKLLLVNAAEALTTIRPITGPPAARTPSTALAAATLLGYTVLFLTTAYWRFRNGRR